MAEETAQKPKATTAAAKASAPAKSGKKAVISTGGHQYLVYEGQELEVELLNPAQQNTAFEALLVIDGDSVSVGTPTVSGTKVTADILEQSVKGEKVVAIRYKAKKRVRKVRGHRQKHTRIKIKKIS
jgi:large subunit ribosomal protein L21